MLIIHLSFYSFFEYYVNLHFLWCYFLGWSQLRYFLSKDWVMSIISSFTWAALCDSFLETVEHYLIKHWTHETEGPSSKPCRMYPTVPCLSVTLLQFHPSETWTWFSHCSFHIKITVLWFECKLYHLFSCVWLIQIVLYCLVK